MEAIEFQTTDKQLTKAIEDWNIRAADARQRSTTVDHIPDVTAEDLAGITGSAVQKMQQQWLTGRLKHRQDCIQLLHRKAELLESIQPELDKNRAVAELALAEQRRMADDHLEACGSGRSSMPAMQTAQKFPQIAERQFMHRINESVTVRAAADDARRAKGIAETCERETRRSITEAEAAEEDLRLFVRDILKG